MRIGIDACTWSNRRGYGRFTRQIVSALVRRHPAHLDRYLALVSKLAEKRAVSARAAH